MDTRQLEPDVLYVLLPPEPRMQPELASLRDRVSEMEDMHVVLDLSHVEIVTSPSIGGLLLLQRQLARRGRRMVICGARLATRCIFRVAGLDGLIDSVENKSDALLAVRRVSESPTEPQ
jgi:anti-anti-sigma factor